ncbi:hypothetical protein XocBAI15_07650 [Xanthomonas oryzae pv. oryzicola]|nr:hypothetical protein XocBAI15_07650 [Xanthomonas oryzae pv. oryzicola]OWB29586.1 hypothetical protein XocBAI20_10765 [Xanthomonas oryzae pv. oryzicola]
MTFRTQAGDFALVGTGRHIGVLATEAVGTDRRADAIPFDIADVDPGQPRKPAGVLTQEGPPGRGGPSIGLTLRMARRRSPPALQGAC